LTGIQRCVKLLYSIRELKVNFTIQLHHWTNDPRLLMCVGQTMSILYTQTRFIFIYWNLLFVEQCD